MTDASEIAAHPRATGPVVPVIVIEDVAHAVPLARALVAGGLRVLEVTLRTAGGARSRSARIATRCPRRIVGAGTVLTGAQLEEAAAVGAAFAVSPGATPALLDAAARLAGAAPAAAPRPRARSMALLERGYTYMKLFPAEAAGGVAALNSLASPLPAARFCPTGGIDPEKAGRYLALPNVVCVGGSWLVPRDAMRQGDWAKITELARGAAALGSGTTPDDGAHRLAGLAGAAGARRGDARRAPARAVRRGPAAASSEFSLQLDDLLLDYSKNRVTDETMRLLLDLAARGRRRGLARPGCSRASRSTSPRTAPSCTWRCATAPNRPILVDGDDVMPEVNARARADARRSPSGSAAAPGAAPPARPSPTSSTSASAAPTSAR